MNALQITLLVVANLVAACLVAIPITLLIMRSANKKVTVALNQERDLGLITPDDIVLHGQFSSGSLLKRLLSMTIFGIGFIFGYRGLTGRIVVLAVSPQTLMLFVQSGYGFNPEGMFENRFLFLRPAINIEIQRITGNKVWAKIKIGEDKTRPLFLQLPKRNCTCTIDQTCNLLCQFRQSDSESFVNF